MELDVERQPLAATPTTTPEITPVFHGFPFEICRYWANNHSAQNIFSKNVIAQYVYTASAANRFPVACLAFNFFYLAGLDS
jgi:hypothetical protein